MQDLLNIKNELIGGVSVQAVSAKELYIGLGSLKSDWARWSEKNIVKNEYFIENRDWTGFSQLLNGNKTMDYGITIEFAKHLAAMARGAWQQC